MTQATDSEIREWIEGRKPEKVVPAVNPDDDGERLEWVRPAALPDVELLIGRHSARRWHAFHENYVICPVDVADAEYRYRGKMFSLATRDFMLMEPGETHRNTAVRVPADFTAFFLTPQLVAEAGRELECGPRPHFRVPKDNDPVLFEALRQFQISLENSHDVLDHQSRFAAWLQRMIEHYAEAPPKPYKVKSEDTALARVRTCLYERHAETVTLDEIATLSGLSRFHLLRVFSKRYGFPPHEYQLGVRITRARTLIRNGVSLAETASLVGFADQSHFTRHFKRILGVTPGQYANAVR
jgi:AraC-like DNA-binding protein